MADIKPIFKPVEAFKLEEETYRGTSDFTDIAQYCHDLYTEYSASSYRKRKLQEIKDGRERYHNERPEKSFPWAGCSNVSVGLTAIAVDNLEPRIKSQIISTDDFIEVEPVGEEDVPQAESVKEFLLWALRNNVRIDTAIKPIIHDYLLDGTIDVLPVWRERTEEYRTRAMKPVYEFQGQRIAVPPDADLNPAQAAQMGLQLVGMEDSYTTKERTIWRVEYVQIPLTDAFFPDNWDSWDDQPYLRLIYPTLEELELQSDKHGGPYKNIDRSLVLEGARNTTENQDEVAEDDIRYSDYTKEVRLLECYIKWRGEWTIATFAIDRGWIEVRRQPLKEVYWHGRKPVRRFRLYPEQRESMGYGLPQKIKDFSTAIDDLWNEMIDSGTVEIIPWFLYEDVTGMATINMEVYPGKGIKVPKDANVTFPNLGVKAPQFMTFINLLLGFFERTISLSDYAMGREGSIGGKGSETFSGMNLIVNEGNIKHNYTGESVRDQFAALFRDTLSLYGQYLPLDAKMRVHKDNKWLFEPVDPVALQGAYDLTINVSNASANKMLHRKETVELTQLIGGNPVVDPVKLASNLLKAYDIKTIEDWIKPEFQQVLAAITENPEIIQMIGQYLQQKQQQQRQAEVEQEARDNLARQDIQRRIESEAGAEDQKIIDQVSESAKRKLVAPVIEDRVAMQLTGSPMPTSQQQGGV